MDAGFGRPVVRVRRIVAQRGILDQQPDDVDAETIDTAVEPEAQHVVHRRAHVGIAPVEIGLLGQKTVQVILAGARLTCPRRSTELRQPVVRRRTVRLAVAPDVPIAFRIDAYARLSRNHGCRSDVWLGTKSRTIFILCACASATRRSKSSSDPNRGSILQ